MDTRISCAPSPEVCIEPPPNAQVCSPRPAPPMKERTRDEIARYEARENDNSRGWLGESLEKSWSERLRQVPPGTATRIELAFEAGPKARLFEKLEVRVEREAEGSYRVELGAGIGLALRRHLGGAKPTGAAAYLDGRASFRFGTLEEAADRLAAMTQVAAQLDLGGRLAMRLAGDPDRLGRFARTLTENAQVLEGALKVEGGAALQGPMGDLFAQAGITPRVKLDLEQGTLRFESELSAGGGAALGLRQKNLEGAEPLSAALITSGLGGSAQVRLTLAATAKLEREDVEAVVSGRQSLVQLARARFGQLEWEEVSTVTVQASALELRGTHRAPVDLESFLRRGLIDRLPIDAQWDWTALEVKEASFGADLMVVAGHVKERHERPLYEQHATPLQAMGEASRQLGRMVGAELAEQGQRALATLRGR